MKTIKKSLALGASAALAISGMGTTFALAATDGSGVDIAKAGVESNHNESVSAVVTEAKVDGLFSFTQAEVATNQELATRLASASKYLCGSQVLEANQAAAPENWELIVSGAVKHPDSISLADYRDSDGAKTLVMGCSCMGNPADGNASANAEITGIPVADLLKAVEPEKGANTIVFTSADGYKVALPLSYVAQRSATIVVAVNGSPLVESVGGTNQLWLGSTPASYFVRDVVGVDVQVRQTPPPSPTSEEARAQLQNLPNIGVLYGGSIR